MNYLEKGKELSKKALEQDDKGNFKEAIELYKEAIDCLLKHKKYEKNQRILDVIDKRVKEYLDRAEYLKRVVEGEKV